MESLLSFNNVSYFYKDGQERVDILNNASYTFEKGRLYALLGPSGSGKTTALALAAALDSPKNGRILFEEKDVKDIGYTLFRRSKRAMVFQSYNLIPYLTAVQNVITGMEIAKTKEKNKKEKAIKLLEEVGLTEDQANRNVLKLSGGQQQRVAIARALACDVDLILADEPTGNLDQSTAEGIIRIFQKLAHDENKCVIMVTHADYVANVADVIIKLDQGKFYSSN